ncbi:putative Serine/threonine-protein kinase PkaA [Streptomyces afghaniensis 772]|uniref:non-specific serine/threonine protein kinase n=1 Tax=Streptomyces afghaniensis 772 TaxID=1283301 RepID=S4MRV5_9ACTN|nr:putative Serine/threonine-protein kinase PkaA [Streptomyces afghaniensis 772]
MAMGRAHVSTHQLVGGRYRLLEIIQRETNRICWYAEDLGAGEVSRPCLVTQIGLPDDAYETERRAAGRLLRTSERMALLCPGRIATVVDAAEEAGTLWTVNEWIDGTPLGELLSEQGTFNCVRAARVGLELLDVLDAAHAEGITHGELSPGQVFVREDHSVVVTGYGLVGATLAPRLTAPAFASPEQARDEHIGPAADLWALGAILYTMVEGRPPFRDRGRPENTLKGVDRLPLRTPVRAGPLTQVVQGLLRKDARERLTRPVVREALTRALSEDPEAAFGVGARAAAARRVRHDAAGGSGVEQTDHGRRDLPGRDHRRGRRARRHPGAARQRHGQRRGGLPGPATGLRRLTGRGNRRQRPRAVRAARHVRLPLPHALSVVPRSQAHPHPYAHAVRPGHGPAARFPDLQGAGGLLRRAPRGLGAAGHRSPGRSAVPRDLRCRR